MAVAEIERRSPFNGLAGQDTSKRNIKLELAGLVVLGFIAVYARTELDGDTQKVVTFALGLTYLFLVFKNIVYGLMGLVVAIGLSPDSVGYPNIRLEDYMLPPLYIIWYLQHNNRREQLIRTPVMGAIKLFVLLVTISTIRGYFFDIIKAQHLILPFYFKNIEYFMLFWLLMNNIKTREDFSLLMIAALFTCVIVAYIAYTNRAGIISQNAGKFVRASGPEGETPNILGGYYMFHMMFAFAFIFAVKNYIYKIAMIVFLLAVAAPMLYTYSRTSFASLLIGLVITSLFIDLRFSLFLTILAVFLPILIPEEALPKDIVDRYTTIMHLFDSESGQPSSWTARTMGWYLYSKATWMQYPFLGKGMGSIGLGIDSAYVKIFIESGALGIMAFGLILVRLGRTGYEVARTAKDNLLKAYGIGYMGAYAGMIVHSIGVSSFSTIRTAEPFWVFSGLLVAVHAMSMSSRELEEEEEVDKKEVSFVSPNFAFR